LWVFHTTPEYSARYIQTEPFPREKVVSDVLRSFSGKFGSGEEGGGTRQGGGRKPAYVAVQRWLYSQTDNPARPSYGWEEGVRLGACGDGWEGGRDGGEGAEGVERAWLSGKGLGERIAASFTRKKR
jgi:predicted NAD/FAD-dependent oxidoreductase